MKDYEELVEAPEVILPVTQEEVNLEAVCAVFEELMENEPINVLRAMWPCGEVENAEEGFIEKEAGKLLNENAIELFVSRSIRTEKRKLNRHEKVHLTKKKFESSILSKSFIKKAHLDRHTRVHTGEKPYECSICMKRFNRKSNLDIHIRVHTGEKPYKCSICTKSFGTKSNLQRHTRIHAGF